MEVELAGHRLSARSVGGIETCFQIKGFDVCLDIGRCPPGAEHRSNLLLTHGHIDHAAGLPYYVSMRSLLGLPPPRVFCPAEAHPHLLRVLEAWTPLQTDTERCTLTAVSPGDSIRLRGDVVAHAFRSQHRLACTGYTLCRRVRKLKPEFVGLPEAEIARRRRAGEEVQDFHDRPEICFPGDTEIAVVESEPTVGAARLLLLECTFIGPDVSPRVARRGGHIHLDDIAERADLFQNEAILLTHFSRRHHPQEIRAEVERRLPPGLRARVHLLLEDALTALPDRG